MTELTARAVPEWVGATPDSAIPPKVRLRVLLRHNRTCYLSGRLITAADKWDVDHVQALANGGENRETNLAPALRDKHREKTAADVAQKAKADRNLKRHMGVRGLKQAIRSPGFAKRDRSQRLRDLAELAALAPAAVAARRAGL